MSNVDASKLPLCVDLDGTLCRTDTLVESFLILLKHQPWAVFFLPVWLLRGRAHLKQQIAKGLTLPLESFPWNEGFLAWLHVQRSAGRSLLLCTAADRHIANQVAAHIGVFSDVFASDGSNNLAGENKRAALVQRFGERGYVYAGNSPTDLKVWQSAASAVVVSGSDGLVTAASRLCPVEATFGDSAGTGRLKLWIRALRIHQWAKNVLIFLPLVLAHRMDLAALTQALTAFVAFSLCASSVYLLNDLLDLESDRHHQSKKSRPFAAGTLSLVQGVLASLVLLIVGAAVSLAYLGPAFLAVLGLYYVLTILYSFALKRLAIVDVLTLAGLYTIRIVAGSAATAIVPSFWLFAFSIFIFLSLGIIKRVAELQISDLSGKQNVRGRGYQADDVALLREMGISAGYLAVLVLALYINSSESRGNYTHPEVLWLLCPLLLYWVSRTWLKTHRGEMHDDPVVFALTDRNSRIVALAFALLLLVAV